MCLDYKGSFPNVVKTFASGTSALFPFIFLHFRGCFPLVVISQVFFFFFFLQLLLLRCYGYLTHFLFLLPGTRSKALTKLSPLNFPQELCPGHLWIREGLEQLLPLLDAEWQSWEGLVSAAEAAGEAFKPLLLFI